PVCSPVTDISSRLHPAATFLPDHEKQDAAQVGNKVLMGNFRQRSHHINFLPHFIVSIQHAFLLLADQVLAQIGVQNCYLGSFFQDPFSGGHHPVIGFDRASPGSSQRYRDTGFGSIAFRHVPFLHFGSHPPASAESNSSRSPGRKGSRISAPNSFPLMESRWGGATGPDGTKPASPGQPRSTAARTSPPVPAGTPSSARPARKRGMPKNSTNTSAVSATLRSSPLEKEFLGRA